MTKESAQTWREFYGVTCAEQAEWVYIKFESDSVYKIWSLLWQRGGMGRTANLIEREDFSARSEGARTRDWSANNAVGREPWPSIAEDMES